MRFRTFARRSILEIVLIVLCVALWIATPRFLTVENLLGVLRNVSMKGVIAFGMTIVIVAGEIDLSVGSMVAFSGCIAAWLAAKYGNLPGAEGTAVVILAVPATILVGTLIGAGSGFLRVKFRVPTFIVTLAWMTVLRGASLLITNGFPISSFPDWFGFIGSGYVWGIPFPAIILLALYVVAHFVMNFTTFGRSVYAVGGNAEAARLSGIRVTRVKIAVMAIVAGLASLAGIMVASQIQSGNATSGMGWELDVIAAVIIGGCSLAGGSGRVWGTLVGVVFLGVLLNGMTILGISSYWQQVVEGALVLGAVLVNMAPATKSERQA
jgi:ribose/xylose/arabinose/galactoside ABC-type transport system permease subunit